MRIRRFSDTVLKQNMFILTSEEEAIRMHAQQIGTEHNFTCDHQRKRLYCASFDERHDINLKKIYVDVLVATGVDSTRAQKEFQSLTAPKKAEKKRILWSQHIVWI